MRLASIVMVATVAIATASAAQADSKDDQAAAQFEQGIALFEEGKHEQAAIAFERAYELKPSYKILYNIGQVQNELGHYAAALQAYTRYLALGGGEIDAARMEVVKGKIARLNNLVGMVIVETDETGATVYVDDERQGKTPLDSPVFVDLGKHTVVIKQGAEELHREAVKVAGGQRVTISVEAESANAAPPAPAVPDPEPDEPIEPATVTFPEDDESPRVWTWVAFGVGGAALIGAGITGGIAASKKSTLEDNCPDKHCPQSEWDTMDSANALATTSTALFAVAGVGIAAGVVLFIVEPDIGEDELAVSIAPTVGPNVVGISAGRRF